MVITSLVAKGKNKILCDDAALIKDMILCEEGLTKQSNCSCSKRWCDGYVRNV